VVALLAMESLTVSQVKALIPNYVVNVAETLQAKGYQAYLVGGSVRDVLLGRSPDDYDVATNAYPEEIAASFVKAIPTGAKFGTVTVVIEDESGERHDVQITTYRSEADYVGGRWPTKVEFTRDIKEDLARRDFTINAMALNLQEFDSVIDPQNTPLTKILIDLFGGLEDLHHKTITAVGDALERFSEDGLRPVRACRLAAQLGFQIEAKTFAAMKGTTHVTKQISVERFREELMKLLLKAPKPSVGLRLMRDAGILQLFIPELLEGEGITQPEFHVDDVFEHSLATVDMAEDSIKLAALFHDIGKPRTRSEDEFGVHFYGHDQVGAEMTKEIMQRLKFSNAEIEHTVKLVRWHMFYYPSADWRKLKKDDFDWVSASPEEIQQHIEETRHGTTAAGWSDAAIRRLIQNIGGEDAIEDLFKLRVADASANPKSEFNPAEIKVLSERVASVRAKDMALKVTDLDITGQDLIQTLNIEAGPVLGEILKHLLDKVIEEPLLNEKSQLLALAKEYLSTKAA
jgi:tRNA nucleotidyltransferase (CCA-adding enzyme)